MKKTLFMVAALFAGTLCFTACSSDKNDNPSVDPTPEETVTTDYLPCIEQILDGCADIANEVGEAKIGDPLNLYNDGQVEKALYAVESWYSWHSRDDYSNNILSIRNSYYGSLDGSVSTKSISAMIAKADASRDNAMKEAIQDAYDAIRDIPQPFRNNINSAEALAAQEACAVLTEEINNLKGYIQKNSSTCNDNSFKDIVENYVDVVVLPTYKNLKTYNTALYSAVLDLIADHTDANYEAAAAAWLDARQPWETSEAFLFGPVDALGLDPNMDSWPLDQDAIDNILATGDFSGLDIEDGMSDDAIEAAQCVRGFHTLEYLLFSDGQPRTVDKANTSENWLTYMGIVAKLLVNDATSLNDCWNTSYENGQPYATLFKNHNID